MPPQETGSGNASGFDKVSKTVSLDQAAPDEANNKRIIVQRIEEGDSQKKDSVLNRKLKSMIKQSKHLNDFHISAFPGNDADGSFEGSDMDAIERSITQHNALRLQQLQEQFHDNKEDESDDSLTREDFQPGNGLGDAMAIVQGFTPSGLATSSNKKKNGGQSSNQNTSSKNPESSPEVLNCPREFYIEEDKDEVVMSAGRQPDHANLIDRMDPSQRSSVQHLREVAPIGTGPSRVTDGEAPPVD